MHGSTTEILWEVLVFRRVDQVFVLLGHADFLDGKELVAGVSITHVCLGLSLATCRITSEMLVALEVLQDWPAFALYWDFGLAALRSVVTKVVGVVHQWSVRRLTAVITLWDDWVFEPNWKWVVMTLSILFLLLVCDLNNIYHLRHMLYFILIMLLCHLLQISQCQVVLLHQLNAL